MFFEEGDKVTCDIGGMTGTFLGFGFDTETRTSVVTVLVGERKVIWPIDNVYKASD